MYYTVSENHTKIASPSYPLFAKESRMVKRYMKYLTQRDKPEILDIGPVSGSNISFFLGHVSKVHICDVLSLIAREPRPGADAERILSFFDFKEKSLDGIHLWDAPDHIDNRTLSLLVKKFHFLLKPNGLLIFIASTTTGIQPHPLFFIMRENYAVMLEKVTTRRLSYFYRSNRDLELCMKPFQQLSSFICTDGLREFLYRNPS